MNAPTSTSIDTYLAEGLTNKVFPSASLLVSKQGRTLYRKNTGCPDDAIFDIASLTKPVATATLLLKLLEEKRVRLNQPISTFLKSFETKDKQLITFKQLSDHISGLPAWKPYFENLLQEQPNLMARWEARQWYLQKIASEELENPIGSKRVYSDLGFIILGIIIENVCKTKLEILFKKYVADSLNLKNTFFLRMGSSSPEALERILPTAEVSVKSGRNRKIQAEVHDDNAYALGGVAGHAGLFSTVDDLDIFLKHIRQNKNKSDIKLGWDSPTAPSQSGQYFSSNSIGHLGYTGCSMWIDFDQDYHIILLTNRTYPSSDNERIKTFRPKLHDLIYKTLILP